MQPQSLAARVERLEKRVIILEELPARVDALTLQVLQLREEMHVKFSATNTKIDALDQRLTGQIESLDQKLTGQIESVKQDLSAHMRVLHEDLVSRLALMQEGRSTRSKQR